MSTPNYWRGDALAVAMVRRFTVGGTPAAGDVIGVTINLKAVTYTLVGGDTAATAAAALYALYVAASFAESKEADPSYTDGNAYFDLTAATAGVPFTGTASATGTTTLTASTVTASTGPSHIDEPLNWSLGATPIAGHAVVVDGGSPILYGLGSFTADSWEFRRGFTQPVGLSQWNSAGYYEYRVRELTINAPTVTVDCGSSRLVLKAVASSTWQVNGTGNRESDAVPALDVGATGNPTAINVAGSADVGILVQDESTARTFAAVSLSGDAAQLTIGRKATATALDMDSGTASALGTVTTATVGRGNYTQADGTLTNLNAYGGLINLGHAGTVASVVAKGRGDGSPPVINCEANNRARTFTNSAFSGGATLQDENKSVTLDAGGTHTADSTFFQGSRLGPEVTWNRT